MGNKNRELLMKIARYIHATFGGGGNFEEARKCQCLYEETAKFAIDSVREFDKNVRRRYEVFRDS